MEFATVPPALGPRPQLDTGMAGTNLKLARAVLFISSSLAPHRISIYNMAFCTGASQQLTIPMWTDYGKAYYFY